MKSFTAKTWNRLSLTLFALTSLGFAMSQPAAAATFSVGGYTWNSDNSVTTGSVIQGSVEPNGPLTGDIFGFDTSFLGTPSPVGNQTVGAILGLHPYVNSSVNLGDDTNRAIIELGWGGKLLKNAAGKDLVFYETGSFGAPEAFAVAVRKTGQSNFTEFLYKFSEGFDTNVFATAFDLSDFGLGDGDAIDAIRISNLIATDKVTGSDGQGFLGGSVTPLTGSQGSGAYSGGRLDPDITYVVGLHDIVAQRPQQQSVPEPTSVLSLLVLGACGASTVRKRKLQ